MTQQVAVLDDELIVVRTPEEFHRAPRAYQKLLISQVMINSEGELSGGDDYTMVFLPLAPNAEERQVCAERAAEEYDHYKIGKKVLADIGVDTTYMETQRLEERNLFADQGLHTCTTWAERGVFSYIGEESALLMIREFAESSYKPWADAVRTIILDEKVHIAHGARVCRNLAATEEGREQLQYAARPAVADVHRGVRQPELQEGRARDPLRPAPDHQRRGPRRVDQDRVPAHPEPGTARSCHRGV